MDLMRIVLALFNFLAFEAAWLAAVTGGAAGRGTLMSLAVVAVVAIHLALNRVRLRSELLLILAVTVFGVLIEAGFMGAGLIRYAGTAEGQMLPPIWIAALWFGFATLPSASLAWLKGRWRLQVLLGGLFGPLTYWGGEKLGAATIPDGGGALFAIGVAWALALPAIFLMAEALSTVPARRTAA
jgi:hypothetical protein